MEKDSFYKIDGKTVLYQLIHLKQIVFEVTDACNLRCKYCAYSDLYEGYDERKNEYLPFEKARMIIEYLADIWKNNTSTSLIEPVAVSFYGGEPLMNMKFIKEVIDYVNHLEGMNKKFFFSMTTNAMLLDRYMDYLAEKEFRLLISLDGDEQGNSYRVDSSVKNSFGRVIKNVKLLQVTYPEYFDKLVQFNSVLHNRNSVYGTYHFIKDVFSKKTRIAPLNNSGIKKDKQEEFWDTYQNMTDSIQKSVNCESLQTELFISNPETSVLLNYINTETGNVYDNYIDLLIDTKKQAYSPTGTCPPFFKKMFITVNGKILQCEKINHEFAVGYISDNKVEIDLDKVAKQQNDFVFRYQKQCSVCALKKKCPQCVFQIDSINNSCTKCLSYISKPAQAKHEQSVFNYLRKHPELYGRIMKEVRVSH